MISKMPSRVGCQFLNGGLFCTLAKNEKYLAKHYPGSKPKDVRCDSAFPEACHHHNKAVKDGDEIR